MLRRSLGPEEGHARAESDDEVVVVERVDLVKLHSALLKVDFGRSGNLDARVRLLVEEIAERMADRRLLEQARRHLVQERLERVEVVPVDDRDVDVSVLQVPRRTNAAEAAAKDQNLWPIRHRLHPSVAVADIVATAQPGGVIRSG